MNSDANPVNSISLPENFQNVIVQYVTELLNSNPTNAQEIYAFSTAYFTQRLEDRQNVIQNTLSSDKVGNSGVSDTERNLNSNKKQNVSVDADFSYDNVVELHPDKFSLPKKLNAMKEVSFFLNEDQLRPNTVEYGLMKKFQEINSAIDGLKYDFAQILDKMSLHRVNIKYEDMFLENSLSEIAKMLWQHSKKREMGSFVNKRDQSSENGENHLKSIQAERRRAKSEAKHVHKQATQLIKSIKQKISELKIKQELDDNSKKVLTPMQANNTHKDFKTNAQQSEEKRDKTRKLISPMPSKSMESLNISLNDIEINEKDSASDYPQAFQSLNNKQHSINNLEENQENRLKDEGSETIPPHNVSETKFIKATANIRTGKDTESFHAWPQQHTDPPKTTNYPSEISNQNNSYQNHTLEEAQASTKDNSEETSSSNDSFASSCYRERENVKTEKSSISNLNKAHEMTGSYFRRYYALAHLHTLKVKNLCKEMCNETIPKSKDIPNQIVCRQKHRSSLAPAKNKDIWQYFFKK